MADVAAAPFPRILYLMLACNAHRERARAVLGTWARQLLPGDRLILLGDDKLAETFPDTSVLPVVTAGSPQDTYSNLPRKTLAGLRHALELPDWDFVFKCDDDTFAWPVRVSTVLAEQSSERPLYLGSGGWNVSVETTRPLKPGESSYSFPFFPGGGGYILTRPALEQAWYALEEELDREGPEDVLLGLGMYRGGVEATALGGFFCHGQCPEQLIFGSAASIHWIPPADIPLFYRLLTGLAARPFELADAHTGWGDVGFYGALGFESQDVRVGGQRWRQTIAAHPNSRLLLRTTPGALFRLQGALNDTSSSPRDAQVTFSVWNREGVLLATLGALSPSGFTTPILVQVPDDGFLSLQISSTWASGCHALWRYSLDPESCPIQAPFWSSL